MHVFDVAIIGDGRAAAAVVRRFGADSVVFAAPWCLGGGEPAAPFRIDTVGQESSFARALIVCDALASEAMRLLGARHHYRGGWVPVLDAWQRSTVPGLYAGGATRAEGEVAACAALADLGLLPQWRAARMILAQAPRLRAARRDARRAARLRAPSADALAALLPSSIVCPCEGLDRAAIEAALDAGARDVNQLKQFTRCGMGPCRGRICAETAAELVALRVGGREAAGIWTARAPLVPLRLSALLGAFDYADIPVPPPAPL